MGNHEKRIKFWKPFLFWGVLFTFAQIACGVTALTLIENGVLDVSDRVDPFRTSLALSTICLIVLSFVGILAGTRKPFIIASMLITCGTSMNPPGTLVFYFLIFGLAIFIKWALAKVKLLVGYYKPIE